MASLSPVGRWALLASALTIACNRPDPRAPRRRAVDATATATDRPRPGPAASDAGVDGGESVETPPLDLFIVGGADLVRPGAAVQARVERLERGHTRPEDVTGAATFQVLPPDRGDVDRAGVFHARALGRAEIVAVVGAQQARTVVEVYAELPAGVMSIPTLQVSDGRIAHSIRLGARPDGVVSMDAQAERLSLRLEGRRRGSTFPITVPVREPSPPGDPGDAGARGPAGTIVLDRWVAGRLDGHATVRVANQTLVLRFTVFMPDAAPLRTPVTP
jgi:hypothetical protein